MRRLNIGRLVRPAKSKRHDVIQRRRARMRNRGASIKTLAALREGRHPDHHHVAIDRIGRGSGVAGRNGARARVA